MIVDKEIMLKRRDEMKRTGVHPMKLARRKLNKAIKEKSDPFTIKKLEEALNKEAEITGSIISEDLTLLKFLSLGRGSNER